MDMNAILSPKAVRGQSNISGKKRLLQEIAAMASELFGFDETNLFGALQERELLGATGMGKGIAVPHARIAEAKTVRGLFIRLETPVPYDAVDRHPVDLVFALFAPEDAGADHLKALARVSRTLRSDEICRKLRSTGDPAALYAILTDAASL